MGVEVDAFIETRVEGSTAEAPAYRTFCRLFLDRAGGLQLHVLGGFDADPPYSVKGMASLTKDAYDQEQERWSEPYEIPGSDDQIESRRRKVSGTVAREVDAAVAALRVLGPNARIVFWYVG